MTQLKDAKLIVPTENLWVSVSEELWEDGMGEMTWNDTLSYYSFKLPPTAVKIGLLTEILRKGKICRPINEYIDFDGQPIAVIKGK